MEEEMGSVVDAFQFGLYLLGVGLSARDEVAEIYHVVDNLHVEGEEGPIASDANAIDGVVADETDAVGDVADVMRLLHFFDGIGYAFPCLAGKQPDGFLELLGILDSHSPRSRSKAACSSSLSMTCPSGSDWQR